MGSTGSTWLAKLLNSHPDVLCYHEQVVIRVHPARSYGDDEISRYVESLSNQTVHGAYRAIGDVGSVWASHAVFAYGFRTAILLRHPARLLRTRLETYPKDQSYSDVPSQSAELIRDLWGIDLPAFDPIDQIFLHDLLTFASQAWAAPKMNLVIRLEDLRSMEYCQRTLHALTGVRFPQRLILNASRSRVNQRATPNQTVADIVASFSKRQRDWYGLLLSEAAPLFGYNLWSDELESPLISSQSASAFL